MDKIAIIRQEIERLKGICTAQIKANPGQTFPFVMEMTGYDKLLSFLDTLSEENALPCWKKVHTYTEELREGDMEKMLLDLSIGKGERKTKIALPDRVVDALSEEPDKGLEEAAYKYSFDSRPSIYGQVDVIDAFIAGAEWQAKQLLQGSPMPEDTVLFNKGVQEGRRLEREDMLKDAVEVTVESPILGPPMVCCIASGCSDGDKVRIVVLKEEEE